MDQKPTVVIAMSGGVDSSVAAALLAEQGYTVIGMMLRLWSEQDAELSNRCCSPEAMSMARRVATQLSIPFYVVDARQLFYDSVIKPFIHDYTHNLTPNPCIPCNRFVRWTFLLNHALSIGADFLATGHYARIFLNNTHSFQVLRGVDRIKDQSYVLHVLTQDQLGHAMFPLGEYTKLQVRQIASQYNLPVADRPESQDLCFIGTDKDYRNFIFRHAPQDLIPGRIIDLQGKTLGVHHGLPLYTIGQRRGLGISAPSPLYVLDKDPSRNVLIVGRREQTARSGLIVENVNWIAGEPPTSHFEAEVKIRYSAPAIPGVVYMHDEQLTHIKFKNPVQDITPGQAAVLYNGEVCLGGGRIINFVDPE